MVEFINKILSLGVIVGQVFVVASLVYVIFFRHLRHPFVIFIERYSLHLALAIALTATAGSLFYSQVVGFTPCDLCWVQRFFMYPLIILIAVTLVKPSKVLLHIIFDMAVVGFLVSLYQNYMYYFGQGILGTCQLFGSTTSCLKRYILEFGYITIPIMALTAFAVIIMLLVFGKLKHTNNTIKLHI